MSDARLRELERRWRERGAVADEVALLRALARAGALTTLQLELAARCGHAAAFEALDGRVAPCDLSSPRVRRVWADDLRRHEKALSVRAVLALASLRPPAGPRAAAALAAAEAWAACPCEAHRAAAADAERPAIDERARRLRAADARAPSGTPWEYVPEFGPITHDAAEEARRSWLATRAAAAAGAADALGASRAVMDVLHDPGPEGLEAVRAALIAAALGR